MAIDNRWPVSGIPVVSGTFTGTANSLPFRPIPGRPFNMTLSGTFVASVVLKRSFDDGGSYHPLTVTSGTIVTTMYNPTAACSEVVQENEEKLLYRLECTWTSGTVTYRLSQ